MKCGIIHLVKAGIVFPVYGEVQFPIGLWIGVGDIQVKIFGEKSGRKIPAIGINPVISIDRPIRYTWSGKSVPGSYIPVSFNAVKNSIIDSFLIRTPNELRVDTACIIAYGRHFLPYNVLK